jgi:hypothetical protein
LSISLNATILKDEQKWNNLLHYKKEFSVKNKEFYLTTQENRTPIIELEKTIELLNNTNGKEIACNFPARYLYIKNENIAVPSYNLNECKKLNSFVRGFKKDKVSIVFTSEYINSPSSAFGHIMLIFNDNNTSIDIADTIHFSAKIDSSHNTFQYAYEITTSRYDAYFIREPFFKKIYQYNTIEQRFMYIYDLNLNKKKILNLIYHIYELRKATFKYDFLYGNCSSEIIELLHIEDKTINLDSNGLFYLPIYAINSLKDKINNTTTLIPIYNKINSLISKMSKDEVDIFNKVIKTNKLPKGTLSDIVKEALVYYSIYNFRKHHIAFKNYDEIMNFKYKKTVLKNNYTDPLKKTQPSNIGIGYYNSSTKNGTSISFRPLLLDKHDIQNNKLQEADISLLNTELIYTNNDIKLYKFDLLDINSYAVQNNFHKPLSWSFYSGYNRNNLSNNLKIENYIGLGATRKYFNSFNSILINVGIENDIAYVKPIYNFSKTYKNVKFGFSIYTKNYTKNNRYINKTFYFNLKLKSFLLGIDLINDNSINDNQLNYSLKYNF